jgi:hypothetical protein
VRDQIRDPRVLSAEGGGFCPVQWYGTLIDGRVFYFRFRGGWARINLAPAGTELYSLPRINLDWDFEAFHDALAREEVYPHSFWADDLAHFDVCGDSDPYRGFFTSEIELNQAFTACLDQLWEVTP